jgi:PadR family transcriptional regulator, regulatory protein PadR
VLHHAADGPIYGLAMMRELGRHGHEVSAGTLYPILHAMEEAGWLERQERLVEGRVRKYYTATPQGRQALTEVKARIRELATEVLDARGPGRLPDSAGEGD